jgi:hypothetical protein
MTQRTKMTPDEANKRRRDLAFQKSQASLQSFTCSIIHQWQRCEKEFGTHDDLLNWRREWMLNTNGYKALTIADKRYLDGVWEAMQRLAYQRLVFCYDIGEGLTLSTDIPSEKLSLCTTENGAHCWKDADGKYHKWS